MIEKKTKVLLTGLIVVLAILIIIVCRSIYVGFEQGHDLRMRGQINYCLSEFFHSETKKVDFPPEDILATDGQPLLSWRVTFFLENASATYLMNEKKNTLPSFNFAENWRTETNLKAAIPRPDFYMYPYNLDSKNNMKTCIVLNKEVADILRKNDYNSVIGHLKNKALIILVDPKDAVPWTAPIDVSWKDLASGKITPFNKDGYFFYVQCGGLEMKWLKRAPCTYDEWHELCGVVPVQRVTDDPKTEGEMPKPDQN